MRYPSLTAEKEKSWRWNCLSSGVDWNSADFAVPENRMADCRNLWWEKNPAGAAGIRGDTVDDGGASPVFSGKCDPFF